MEVLKKKLKNNSENNIYFSKFIYYLTISKNIMLK